MKKNSGPFIALCIPFDDIRLKYCRIRTLFITLSGKTLFAPSVFFTSKTDFSLFFFLPYCFLPVYRYNYKQKRTGFKRTFMQQGGA